jgi:hypothetical protein
MPVDRYGTNWPIADLKAYAAEVELSNGIPSGGLVALIQQESAWNPQAVSQAGAIGLAQFMPPTAAEWEVDPWDPIDSISGAGRYLAWLRSRTPSWTAALASYNYGIGNVSRNIAANDGLNVSKLPKETRNYVKKLAPAFGEDPTSSAAPGGTPEDSGGLNPLLLAAGIALVWAGVQS